MKHPCEAGCGRVVYARGHCARHYKQLLRHGAVQPDREPIPCDVPTCGRAAVTRSWCHGHYLRWSRTGDVQADRPLGRDPDDGCSVEDCDRGRHTAGLCRPHAARLARHGDPLGGGPVRLRGGGGALSHGYWLVSVKPEQRHLVPPGRRVELEHRMVMAGQLGRPLLSEETVHHRNGDRLDNRPGNLELWSTAQPKGQRIPDKLAFALELVRTCDPEAAATLGLDLDPDTGLPRACPTARPQQ